MRFVVGGWSNGLGLWSADFGLGDLSLQPLVRCVDGAEWAIVGLWDYEAR